jgi:glycosyltransferase involved in cell wall biosynthesis
MKSHSYLIVTGDFVPTGGMDRANLALARYLADRPETASEVHLVAHRATEDLANLPRVRFHRVPRPLGSHWLAGPLLDRAGRRLARTIRPACVVVNGGNCRTSLAAANWVHYLHACWSPSDHQAFRPPWHRRLKYALAHRQFLNEERTALDRSPVIIANSRLTAAHIGRHYPHLADRVRVVYYGTDADRFGPVSPAERSAGRAALGLADDRPTVLFVGALGDARKGFDILFDAWVILKTRRDWDAQLLVAGAGASVAHYERLAREKSLGDSIAFLGFRNDIPNILAASDLLVSPVRYEAYGLNVHEALCREIPVLVSADSGIAERLVDDTHEGGQAWMKLPNPVDAASLAESLRHWRSRPDAYRHAARAAGSRLRSASWDDRMTEFVGNLSSDRCS